MQKSKILVVTAHRPEKTVDPIETVDGSDGIILDNTKSYSRKYVAFLFKCLNSVNNTEYDAILVNGTNLLGLITLLIGRFTKTPVIIRLGGDIWERNRKKIQRYWKTRCHIKLMEYALRSVVTSVVLRGAEGYITVSSDLKERTVKKLNCDEGNVKVVHSPVKHDQFSQQPANGIPASFDSSKSVILTVSNLKFPAKYRGVIDILDELSPILEEREDVIYVIAGGGRYLTKIEEYIEANRINNVYLLGYVDNVEKIYLSSHIFTYVSYNDGYPNVVLEAGAAGLPRITNDEGGISEQINDGKDGIITDIENTGSLRDSVETLLDNPERASELGERARRKVRDCNNDRTTGKQMHDAVTDIVNR